MHCSSEKISEYNTYYIFSLLLKMDSKEKQKDKTEFDSFIQVSTDVSTVFLPQECENIDTVNSSLR